VWSREIAIAVLVGCGCGRLGFAPQALASSDATDTNSSDADPCSALSAGLIAYWPLDAADVASINVLDRSGNSHHGTLSGPNPPTVGPGRKGDALHFNATQPGWVDVGSLPFDVAPGAMNTISMWFYRAGPTPINETLLFFPTTAIPAAPRYDLWLSDAYGPLSLCFNGGVGDCWGLSDPAMLLDRWIYVTLVIANGPMVNGEIYIDGMPVNMSCQFTSQNNCDQSRTATGPVILGADDVYAFHGRLDDVRVYDRLLDPSEVATLYACSQ